jgi:hypothetical protein
MFFCRQLSPDFVRAVRTSPVPLRKLTVAAGFPFHTNFLQFCQKRRVITPGTHSRLLKLAELVGYEGALFTERKS